MLKVQLRGGFSDRNGINKENTTIQLFDFDDRTRTAIATTTSVIHRYRLVLMSYDQTQAFVKQMLSEVYGIFIDWAKTYSLDGLMKAIYETIDGDDYASILTVVEYLERHIVGKVPFRNSSYTVAELYNDAFEREYVGYRIVDHHVMRITDELEIAAIEEAAHTEEFEVRQHFQKAMSFLADREAPDYANSIKESITAVERMCSIIVGKATTLSDALKNLSKVGVEIHPALKDGFNKLYAYTNDASGLRHAGQLGGKDATFEEAKFMLVSCCAFVNYLTGVMAKTEK